MSSHAEVMAMCLGAYEAAKRLGFEPHEVTVGVQPRWVLVRIARGPKSFDIAVAERDGITPERFQKLWEQAVNDWTTGTQDYRENVFARWEKQMPRGALKKALQAKGLL